MNGQISYPAKLFLFGEYSILLGSSALSMPVNAFSAKLDFIKTQSGNDLIQAEQSNRQIRKLFEHYYKNSSVFGVFLDLENFKSDTRNGLFLSSTIPQRFGMGSSGALCAAVYGGYGKNPEKENLSSLHEKFIQMESFFHGKSSGFDPLTIFMQKSILLDKNGKAIMGGISPQKNDGKLDILLINSGIPRPKNPYVQQFLDQFAPGGKMTSPADVFIDLTDRCIDSYYRDPVTEIWQNISKLSAFQIVQMAHLIPEKLHPAWKEGLQTGLFALKLCGSGGGGYFTCFTQDKVAVSDYFSNHNIHMVVL